MRKKTVLLLLALLLFLCSAAYAGYPGEQALPRIELGRDELLLDMNARMTGRLSYTVHGDYSSLTWESTDPSVAQVSADGLVRAVAPGECMLRVRADAGVWALCRVCVKGNAVRSMTLCVGGSTALKGTVSDERILRANSDGTVTALRSGTAFVRTDTALYRITVTAPGIATGISCVESLITLRAGEYCLPDVRMTPDDASPCIRLFSEDKNVVCVENGTLHAVNRGKTLVRIESAADPSVHTYVGVVVVSGAPQTISFSREVYDLAQGTRVRIAPSLTPEDCDGSLVFTSSAPETVSVDANGVLETCGPGEATITAVSALDDSVRASMLVRVEAARYSTDVPARTTAPDGIAANLAAIANIEQEAYRALSDCVGRGLLKKREAQAREEILRRAFVMYSFAWTPEEYCAYWSGAGNGEKDYIPGTIYYGLPYIQCGENSDTANRMFSVKRALAGGYYTDTGNGYYRMSAQRKLNGRYVGCDCSSFVSMAQWGTGTPYSAFTTFQLRTDKEVYKTVPWDKEMLPGDILVRSGHAVLFLYYTDDAHTQMMILEQGGGNIQIDMHNTVTCSVVRVAAYSGDGFVIRRKRSYTD